MIRTILNLLSEAIAPRSCSACDAPNIGATSAFCAACAATLVVDISRGVNVAAFEYGGALATAIRRFKYGVADASLAPILGALACRALPRLMHPVEVVTHVPLHSKRLVERGFDQAAFLGKSVADSLGVRIAYGALRRTRDTAQQASLGRASRYENVRDAFALARRADVFIGKSVLVVDDVRTTGATLEACARVIREAGATTTQTLVLAQDV